MKGLTPFAVVCCLMAAWPAARVEAQSAIPGFDVTLGYTTEILPVEIIHWAYPLKGTHFRLTGPAAEVLTAGGGTQFYADLIDYYDWEHRMVAVGRVLFAETGSRIQADRVEFNTETRMATFYNAIGTVSLGARADRSMFGTLEPDMMFEGTLVEKIGERKYKITKGRFTTCVQAVPRWELVSGTVVLNLEHYATLKNSVLEAKGVPVFYIPFVYYPITKEDRATGFLMPTYGTSSLRGFSLSNAFFWAIDRSQDLTVMHDWFTSTGQGLGAEYRYVLGPTSSGTARVYVLNQHEVITSLPGGTESITPGSRSYQVRGSMNQGLGRKWRIRGSVDYFTDLTVQQTYNLNILDASRSQRTLLGSIDGSIGSFNLAGPFNRSDYFAGATSATRTGSTPQLSFSRRQQPLGGLPLYFAFTSEAVHIERKSLDESTSPATVLSDQSLYRGDFSPTLRFPFTKLSFLSANSSVSWHGTYWTRSLDQANQPVDAPISRHYFEFQTNITGPSFNRVFDTPGSSYAEKFKHTIEPFVGFSYLTATYDFNRIIKNDAPDFTIGGVTKISYGIDNRLYAKVKLDGGVATAREIVSISIRQTYYTNPDASQFDRNFTSSFTGAAPSSKSPIQLSATASPTPRINTNVTAEFDPVFTKIQSFSSSAAVSSGQWLQTSLGWSFTRSIDPTGLTDPVIITHTINAAASVRLAQNRYGGNWSMNYDVVHGGLLQQHFAGFYNAQCCGFAIEYQIYNFAGIPGARVPQDRRFNFSFTLAGLGTFSNFFGALAGASR
jgi:lipopolysaccharide assembly outer membrane protein LptD (OstA)